jgi:ubiquinone/menaquinone biosynthesis C-methylase UbiE
LTGNHFFEDVATFLGPSYLRYSFTKGTAQEVRFLVEHLGLQKGMRVLDVGCGPGRHALALGAEGIEVVGIDISQAFIDLGNAAAKKANVEQLVTFQSGDARALPFDREFDAVISMCQGGFGLVGRTQDGAADDSVLNGMATALKPGGRLGVSAFSAYFQLQHLESHDTFDAATGVNHERTELRNEQNERKEVDLWTTCFTPRELRLLLELANLTVDHIYSVTPGSYAQTEPTIDTPEFFAVAHK